MKECDRCRHLDFRFNNDRPESNPEPIFYVCSKEVHDLTQVQDIETLQVECVSFSSRYIEYPIEVSDIEYPEQGGIINTRLTQVGAWVAVRPCNKKYEDKTFLGIYLGEADIGLNVRHNSETHRLTFTRNYNPAIFVPDLNEIIYGCGSFWRKIKSEEDLLQISDKDIQNVWYMKALRSLSASHFSENNNLGGAEYVI